MAARCDALPKCVAPDRLAARLHALSGARIAAVDLSPDRVALSKEAGVEAYVVKKSLAATFASVLPQALAAAKEKPWDDTAGLGARVVIQGSCTGSFSIPYALAAGDMTDMI